MNFIMFILVGFIAGLVATAVVRAHAFGTMGNILVGVVGAFIGGILFDIFNMQVYGFWGAAAMATVGAVVFLVIAGLFPRVPSSQGPSTHQKV